MQNLFLGTEIREAIVKAGVEHWQEESWGDVWGTVSGTMRLDVGGACPPHSGLFIPWKAVTEWSPSPRRDSRALRLVSASHIHDLYFSKPCSLVCFPQSFQCGKRHMSINDIYPWIHIYTKYTWIEMTYKWIDILNVYSSGFRYSHIVDQLSPPSISWTLLVMQNWNLLHTNP